MTERNVLPKNLKPLHYDIQIYDIDIQSFTFSGKVSIDFAVLQPTKEIQVNFKDMEIQEAKVTLEQSKTHAEFAVSTIDHNVEAEVVTFHLNEEIRPNLSNNLTLHLTYAGKILDNMAGFYRSRYKDSNGNDAIQLSTQFEAADARRAFPCCDEPNLKATFQIHLAVPEEWTALSNMPILSSKSLQDGKKSGSLTDIKVVTFEKTPLMSTYLAAWAIGDFEYIEAFTKKSYNGRKLPVRVYTTKGLKEQGRLGLESAVKIIDYYSEIFEIDFCLPKLDLIAIHEYSHGAMENWGLIVYRTTALLFDPATSDSQFRTRVVYVVAHEIAHQWFGDLVTMDWWEQLWLNEGFATWAGWAAVENLYPEWDVFSMFVYEHLQQGLTLDSFRGSHPIEVPIQDASQVSQIFDHISYLKGASIIRMLSSKLGLKTFVKGVARYLKRHSYSNASTADLWDAIGKECGQDINSYLNTWTSKIGFPIVTVKETEGGDVVLRQDRFLAGGDVKDSENTTVWWVPLAIDASNVRSEYQEMFHREMTIPRLAQENYKINKDHIGFYRVAYPPDRLAQLGKSPSLSIQDKIGLIADANATAAAGLTSTSSFLDLVSVMSKEQNIWVWSLIISSLSRTLTVWSSSDRVYSSLKKFAQELVTPSLQRLGWEFDPQEDYLTSRLRSAILSFAATVDVSSAIEKSKLLFQEWKSNKSAIHPSLRVAVFSAAVTNSTGTELDDIFGALLEEVMHPTSVDGPEAATKALGQVSDLTMVNKTLDLILDGQIPPQELLVFLSSLGQNPVTRNALWQYHKAHWNEIFARHGTNYAFFERYVRSLLANFGTKNIYDDARKFFLDKDTTGWDMALGQCLDAIKSAYEWVDRDVADVEKFVKRYH
jgi:aminopeptidase N